MRSRALWTLQWNSGRYGGALLIFFTVGSKCCDFKRVICLSFGRFLTFPPSTWRKLQFFFMSIFDTLSCLSKKLPKSKYAARPLLLMRSPALSTHFLLRPSSGSFLISVIIAFPLNFINSTFGSDGPCLIPCSVVSKLLTAAQRSVTKERGTGTALAKVGQLWNKCWVDFSCCCYNKRMLTGNSLVISSQ